MDGNLNGKIAIPAEMGKDEEISLLREITTLLPDDSYLKGLFTDEFIKWVAGMIRKDFLPDMFQAYSTTMENVAGLAERLAIAHENISTADKQRETMREGYDKLFLEHTRVLGAAEQMRNRLNYLEQQCETYADASEVHTRAFNRVDEERMNLVTEYGRLRAMYEQCKDELATSHQTILELKAKLHDLGR